MKVEHLSFSYGERQVLKDISFHAQYGELLSVLGPNGVGKSTLFRCILGLLTPEGGSASIDGTPIREMNAHELSQHIAYIPQSHNPTFNYTVLDMVLMGTTSQMGAFASPNRRCVKKAKEALIRLGIGHLKDRGYAQISGGERQLVLIARAMVQNARILVMDEPSANLDYGNRIKVMNTVRDLVNDGYAVIQSTHDPDQAYLYSDKILAIHEGEVMAFGTPEKVLSDELISELYDVDMDTIMENRRKKEWKNVS